MKFCLIAFIVMVLATHQCAFGKKCKVKVNLMRDVRAVPSILNKLPGINILVSTVEKLSNIKDTIQPIFEELKDLIDNGLDIADNIKETYIQLYGAIDTKVGDIIQLISDKLEIGTNVAQNIIDQVNQILNDLTKAGQNFVNSGLGTSGKSSKCSKAISEAGKKFSNGLIANAESCVKDVVNTVTRHIQKLQTLQLEINESIQTGKVRVQLLRDTLQEAISIKTDIGSSLKNLGACQMKGLSNSLSTFTSSYASATLSCITSITSIFGKFGK